MQSTIICIVVLNNCIGLCVDRLKQSVVVKCCSILYVFDCCTVLAAAIGQLTRYGVCVLHLSNCVVIQSLLQTKVTLLNGIRNTVHLSKLIITQRAETVFQTVEFVDNSLVIKTCLQVCTSCWSRASTTGSRTSISKESASAAPSSEKSKDNNNGPPVVTPSAVVVSTVCSCYRCDIRNTWYITGIEHNMFLLKNLFTNENFLDRAHYLKNSRFASEHKKETLPK